MKFGFIGLGRMGGGLCANLIKRGGDVVIYDINPKTVQHFVDLGAAAAKSVADLASQVDACVTCLPMPKDVEGVLLGENGVFDNMKKGAAHFDLSTLDIPSVVRFEKEAQARGLHYLVIPMGKGPAQAAAGETPLFAGGEKEIYDIFKEPLLEKMGHPTYMGTVTAAEAFKLITNCMGMSNMIIVTEGIKLAKKMGISKEAFLENCPNTGAYSYQFAGIGGLVYDEIFDQPRFAVDLALKDVRLGVEMANSVNQKMPMFTLARDILKKTSDAGLGQADFFSVYKTLEMD